jgi:hypothetical protein
MIDESGEDDLEALEGSKEASEGAICESEALREGTKRSSCG